MTNENMLALRKSAQRMDAVDSLNTREMVMVRMNDERPSIKEWVQSLASWVMNLREKTEVSGIENKRQAQLS